MVLEKSQKKQCIFSPPHPPDVGAVNLHALNIPKVPIADWKYHGNLAQKYSENERNARNKLAAFYRLVDLFQWSEGIQNNITLRISDSNNANAEFLVNPFGLLFPEVTASNLVKIDLNGNVIDPGSNKMAISQTAYVLHSAVHEARPEVRCVVHLHTPVVVAVASMKCGLMPISQEAMILGPIAYHDYKGVVSDESEKKLIVKDLGNKNVMILRNHGFVICAESVEYALHLAFHLMLACQTQIRAVNVGLDNINMPEPNAVKRTYEMTLRAGIGGSVRRASKGGENGLEHDKHDYPSLQWRVGEREWEAWMRVLDATGHETGHDYRMPKLQNLYENATN